MQQSLGNAIAVVNKKGGVGKTTLAAHLAGLSASPDARVLLVDLDPQANTHLDLGYPSPGGPEFVIALEYGPAVVRPPVIPDVRPGLDVLPGGAQLSSWADKATALRKDTPDGHVHASLSRLLSQYAATYALIVIDCPPGDQALQLLALTAARFLLCPIKSDAASMEGLEQLAQLFTEVRDGRGPNLPQPLNPDLQLLGVAHLFCPHNATTVRRRVQEQVEALFGVTDVLFDTGIRHSELAATQLRRHGLLATQYATLTTSTSRHPAGAGTAGAVSERPSAAAGSLAEDWYALIEEILKRFLATSDSAHRGAP